MRRRLVLAVLALAALPASATAADETVTARVDALRTGFVAGSPLQPPLRLRWQANLGAVGRPPLVAGGRVTYLRLPGTGRFITALDAATGKTLWDVPLPGTGSVDMSQDAGRVLVAAAEFLYAFDAATGRQLWRKRFEEGYPEGYASSFVVGRDGVVYAIRDIGTARLHALRGDTGATIWEAPITSGTGAGPTVDADTVYVVQGGGVVEAFARSNGAQRWAFRTCCTGGGGSFAVRTGGVLLQAESAPQTHDARTGQVVGGFTGPLPLVTPSLFVHPAGNGVRATGHDGSPRWSWSPGPDASVGVATVAGGSVVATVQEEGLVTLDAASGTPTWCAAPVAPPGSETFPKLGGIAAGNGLLVAGFGFGLFAFENGGTDSGCRPVEPPPPPLTTSAAPAIALKAGRTELRLGERTRLLGAVTGVASPAGRDVVLQVDEHPFDDRWTTGERVRAGADGAFGAVASPPRNVRVRAVSGELVSAPITLWADFPASLRRFGAGTARPRLRFEVAAGRGAQIRKRRVVFYLARRGEKELRRIGARRFDVLRPRFARVTMPYPRGALRANDRVLVCTREPAGGDGFGRPTAVDASCGARRLPLSAAR